MDGKGETTFGWVAEAYPSALAARLLIDHLILRLRRSVPLASFVGLSTVCPCVSTTRIDQPKHAISTASRTYGYRLHSEGDASTK
jgi:hypothetical protein